jgi:acetoin utilization deacetylase AcuC-like enzyme
LDGVSRAVVYISAGPEAALHDTGPGHPERSARLTAVDEGVDSAGLGDDLVRLSPRPATSGEIERVHQPDYLRAVERFVAAGGGHIDADTAVSPGSWEAALLAAGGGLTAVESLDSGLASAAFVASRPPGHHATANTAMGFCLINNVAVTAAALADRGERVLIVDWDVHHGNGTQDIFWNDPRVMYVSTHQWPCYPGTGRAQEVGGPEAAGATLNVPLPAGATGDAALMALDEVVAPEVQGFGPTWILISAGFDAHRDDPLAELAWSAGDYADLTRTLLGWAPAPRRTIAFLEGGYDLAALARSVTATVAGLAGKRLTAEAPTAGGPGREAVEAAASVRHRLLS